MNKHLKRQLQLAGLLNENKQTNNLSSMELVKEGKDGLTYAIVRENKKYFIKKAETKQNLTEHDFDFLHGLANKVKSGYSSFEDATVKLNLIFEDINRNFDGDSVNILENDILDEKKYVLKQPKPKPVEPELDFGGEDEGDAFDFGTDEEGGDEEFDFGDEASDEASDEEFDFGDEGAEEGGEEFDFGDEASDEDFGLEDEEPEEDFGVETGDNIKDIQKLTGKLGQELRDTEDISSDMQKWVAKSVISALNMDSLDSSDRQDIVDAISGGDEGLEEVVLGVDELPDEDDYHDYDEELTGPGGPEWTLPMKEYDEDLETDRGGERELDDEQLLFDNNINPRNGRKRAMLQQKPNPIEEEDNILRASDLEDDEDYHEYSGELDNQGGPNWSLPRSNGSRRAFRRMGESVEDINEHHFNDRMNSHEQLNAYLDVEDMIRSYGFELGWCHEEGDEDPERKIVYLDLKDGDEKLAKIRINSVGDMEIGYMEGKNFIGEPLDSLSDIDEYLGEENYMTEDMYENNNPAPAKPTTKPGTRPSEDDPWAPTPTEDPDPKAVKDDSPAPAKPTTKPGTKPQEDDPWAPTPTEDPNPKAGYDDDVEFE